MKKFLKKFLKLLVVVAVLGGAAYGVKFFFFTEKVSDAAGPLVSAKVTLATISTTISATGTLEPVDQVALNKIKGDIFSANVYVFTPKGDVLDFPNGSTPLDFAYRVHTEVGNHTVGALVNSRIVPLTYQLKTGDVIEIKTNKSFNGPSEAWLKIVKTSHAKAKIMGILNKRKREELEKKGKEDFERTLKLFNQNVKLDDKMVKDNYAKAQINTVLDFYFNIGKGIISSQGAMNRFLGINEKNNEDAVIHHYENLDKIAKPKRVASESGVYVEGLPKAQIKLASCCHPVFGDDIIGYVSKGNGIIVHRFECHNVKNSQEERFIDVFWDDPKEGKVYETILLITSFDRRNIVADIINIINGINHVSISSITSQTDKSGDLETKVKLKVDNRDTINNVINNLNKITDVYRIERLIK